MTYANLKKFITQGRFTKEEATERVDTFYMVGRLSSDEYVDLLALINNTYPTESGK